MEASQGGESYEERLSNQYLTDWSHVFGNCVVFLGLGVQAALCQLQMENPQLEDWERSVFVVLAWTWCSAWNGGPGLNLTFFEVRKGPTGIL